MHIKTSEGTHSVTSQGQGNLNSVLGGLGTASFLGLNANNLFGNGCGNGGLFGGNRNGDHCYETKECSVLREQVSILQSENFARQAATQAFTDSVTYTEKQNDKQAVILERLSNAVISLQTENATLKADIRCLSVVNEKDHAAIIEGYKNAVAIEAERRKCGDENIVAWTQGELYKKANLSQYIDGSNVFCPQNNICGVIGASAASTSCDCTASKVSK